MAEPPEWAGRRIPMLRAGSQQPSISEETDESSQSDGERYDDDRPAVYTFVEWVRPAPLLPQPRPVRRSDGAAGRSVWLFRWLLATGPMLMPAALTEVEVV